MTLAPSVRVALAASRTVATGVLAEKWIPRDPACVASVRRFAYDTATDWAVADDIPDVAALLVSELATNAFTHVPMAGPVRITLAREAELLIVEVHDPSTEIPRVTASADLAAESGRGLTIVHNLAHNWGWTLTPTGKCVWFDLLAWPTGGTRQEGAAESG
ncbi:ATP-binding protein [Spongiactinospora sp. TRM90649]|uniref:ATP-binding protein n=1 Tax=Spongiactinospora sp. TRM90649 TaxID=3031114 RepID=UPI0023F8DC21|nr:ATP-binding protein [Spongiactinospora sp. TRM90649]MDF5756467.1 ATP-binding protein [Spongiactinospora sp. TRM90649]